MDERKCVSETNKQTKQQHFSTGAPRQLCIRLPGSCLVGTTRVTYVHTWVMRRSCLNASRQQQPAAGSSEGTIRVAMCLLVWGTSEGHAKHLHEKYIYSVYIISVSMCAHACTHTSTERLVNTEIKIFNITNAQRRMTDERIYFPGTSPTSRRWSPRKTPAQERSTDHHGPAWAVPRGGHGKGQ